MSENIIVKKFKDKGVLRLKSNIYTLNNLLDSNTNMVEIKLVKQAIEHSLNEQTIIFLELKK